MNWFNPYYCFHKARQGDYGYTPGYCTGNLLILVFSALLLVASTALLYWHLKDGHWKKKKSYTKAKTWLFILLVLFLATVVLRYLFTLYSTNFYNFLLATAQVIQSSVIYFACHIFAIKASASEDLKKIKTLLGILFVVFICAFFGMFIW